MLQGLDISQPTNCGIVIFLAECFDLGWPGSTLLEYPLREGQANSGQVHGQTAPFRHPPANYIGAWRGGGEASRSWPNNVTCKKKQRSRQTEVSVLAQALRLTILVIDCTLYPSRVLDCTSNMILD